MIFHDILCGKETHVRWPADLLYSPGCTYLVGWSTLTATLSRPLNPHRCGSLIDHYRLYEQCSIALTN